MPQSERLLLGPGPSNPYPEAVAALTRPVLGHLDPEFLALLEWSRFERRQSQQTAHAVTIDTYVPPRPGKTPLADEPESSSIPVPRYGRTAEIQCAALPVRDDLDREVLRTLPGSCHGTIRFLLQVEISTIYKRGDRTRKVHHLCCVPDFDAAEEFSRRLARRGNLGSDGRPILGVDSRDLLEITLESSPTRTYDNLLERLAGPVAHRTAPEGAATALA